MKEFSAILLSVLLVLGPGLQPLVAQQIPSPWSDGALRPPQFGPPQLQGAQSSQSPAGNFSQFNQRYCHWVSANQAPSLPPSFEAQASPRVTPVQGPWPGTMDPGKIDEVSNFQRSRAGIPASQNLGLEPFSAIETTFQAPVFPGEKPRDLRQYGYSMFASPVSTFAPVEDVPVGPDYVLGPGDDMAIQIWGAMEGAIVRTVDRSGQIVLPSVGPVRVWGLTFSQADKLIREQLSHFYRGFQTNVTMGRLRTIRVFVVGEVCQPGSFTLSSLSTVTNALFAAGGPIKLGSLRNIQVKRNHHDVGTLDLYDFLLKGDKTRDFRLESGDTIFVPPIGAIAAITGEVKRPAIYEITGTVRVSDLIEMAGGPTPQSYLKRVQVIRTKPNAERLIIDLDLTQTGANSDAPRDLELRNGDLVRVHPTDPRIYNTVTLTGAVKHSGEYELKPGMRLTELLRKENLLPEAYADRVEIARLNDDLTTEIFSIDVKKAWEGDRSQDITLRRLDLISVRSEFRLPGEIRLEGEVTRPGTYRFQRGERLSSVLKRAGGLTDKAYPKGAVFTRRSVQELEKKRLDEFVQIQKQRVLVETTRPTLVSTGLSKEELIAQQTLLNQRREQIELLASKVTLGRVVIHLDDYAKFEGSPNDVVLEDGDTLKIPQRPASVMVMGSVRNPTGIVFKEGMDVQFYLNRAGGLTPEADANGIHLLKADGSAIVGFMRLRDIDPGDAIVVPPSMEAKVQWLPLLKDLATIAGQVALGLAGLAALF